MVILGDGTSVVRRRADDFADADIDEGSDQLGCRKETHEILRLGGHLVKELLECE